MAFNFWAIFLVFFHHWGNFLHGFVSSLRIRIRIEKNSWIRIRKNWMRIHRPQPWFFLRSNIELIWDLSVHSPCICGSGRKSNTDLCGSRSEARISSRNTGNKRCMQKSSSFYNQTLLKNTVILSVVRLSAKILCNFIAHFSFNVA